MAFTKRKSHLEYVRVLHQGMVIYCRKLKLLLILLFNHAQVTIVGVHGRTLAFVQPHVVKMQPEAECASVNGMTRSLQSLKNVLRKKHRLYDVE